MSSSPILPNFIEGEAAFDYPAAGKPLKTWYRVTGVLTPTSVPLFILHGGPAVGAEAYNILSDLTVKYGIPIIQYDQVGCKRSTHLPEKAGVGEEFWNEDLFLAELHNLVHHFGLNADGRQYDVIGHSWGGMLGSSFAAGKPKGLRKYVIWSSPASTELWLVAQNALRKTLPSNVQDTLKKCEDNGTTDGEEYKKAMDEYYGRFLCRIHPFPADVQDGLDELARDPTAYQSLWGPSEWYVTGTLKNWSVLDRLGAIDVPVLLINGRYDTAQDSCTSAFFSRVKRIKWVHFSESAHMAHYEERERFMDVVGDFLSRDAEESKEP